MKKAFVTSLFIGDKMKNPDTPLRFNKMKDYDYFLFTNMGKNKFNTSWDIINTDFDYTNSIIKSRVPKFQVWEIEMLKNYDIIIYCDAYFSPINNSKGWDKIIEQVLKSEVGIIQSKNPYRKCAYDECDEIVRLKKDTKENGEKTKQFLRDKGLPDNFGLWRNTFLCYNKNNQNVKILFDKLWEYYKENEYTYRDQPLYSLASFLTNITPEEVFCKELVHKFFKLGKMGNHTYI